MSKTLLIAAGPGADAEPTLRFPLEPTAQRSTAMYAGQYRHAQEMQRERLRQAEAQRLRRTALRARRSLAARLLGQ